LTVYKYYLLTIHFFKVLSFIYLPAALTISFYIDSSTKGTDKGMQRVRRQGTVTDNCVQHLEAC